MPVVLEPAAPPRTVVPEGCFGGGAFPPLLAGQRYGINAFLLHTDQERVLALSKGAGFSWLRQQIHWRDIETSPGRYDWGPLDQAVEAAGRKQMRLLISVVRSPRWTTASGAGGLPDDPATLAVFLDRLAQRYAGRVSAYQIWNEPNLAVENGGRAADPARYLAVLQAAYPAVKHADPCALVLAAPLAATATDDPAVAVDNLAFYRQLYALEDGAFLRAADALAMHPGGGPFRFDARWPEDQPAQSRFYFHHIEELRALMQASGDPRQVWITEVGWAVQAAPGAPLPVSPEQQAENLVGVVQQLADEPWVAAVFVWNLNFAVLGAPDDEKSAFGILAPDWTPRPAYLALQQELSARAATERAAQPRLSGGAPFAARWQARIQGKSRTPPVLAPDGTLYVASDPGMLAAFAPGGGLRWSFQAPGSTRAAPALDPAGMLYLGDTSGGLTALRPDGVVVWQRQLGRPISSAPLLDRGRLFVAAGDTLLALDRSGAEIWRTALGAELNQPLLGGSPGVQVLYLTTTSGGVAALTADGRQLWRAELGQRVASGAALAGDTLLVGDAEGFLHSLRAADGQPRWAVQVAERIESPTLTPGSALIQAPALVAGGTIYQAGRDGRLSALDLSGRLRWRYNSGSDLSAAPLLDASGMLYAGTMDERLLALDQDGQLRWQATLKGSMRSPPTLGPDGALYVSTLGGLVYALGQI